MPVPTAQLVFEESNVDLAAAGYPVGPRLDRLVRVALALVRRHAGQGWSPDGLVFVPGAPVTLADEPLVEHAVITLVQFLALRSSADVVETMADFDLLTSFSAGSYSESRRSGKDAADANRAFLRSVLWPVMSDEARDQWLSEDTGVNAPAFAVTEVDWSGSLMGQVGPDGAPWIVDY